MVEVTAQVSFNDFVRGRIYLVDETDAQLPFLLRNGYLSANTFDALLGVDYGLAGRGGSGVVADFDPVVVGVGVSADTSGQAVTDVTHRLEQSADHVDGAGGGGPEGAVDDSAGVDRGESFGT